MSAASRAEPALADALECLREQPSLLEPGVRFFPEALQMEGGVAVPLHGVDPLGHPILVFVVEEFLPETYDEMLEVVARLHAEPARFAGRYREPERPRLFLVARDVPRRAHQRLALLARAFPVRALLASAPAANDAAWSLEAFSPAPDTDPEGQLEDLPAAVRQRGKRLVLAAGAIEPPLEVTTASWPWVFRGRRGAYAALHRRAGQLWFARETEAGLEVLELEDDHAVDLAIDLLQREQWAAAPIPA